MTANSPPPTFSPGMAYATYDFYLLIKYRYRIDIAIFGNIVSISYRIPKTNIVASLVDNVRKPRLSENPPHTQCCAYDPIYFGLWYG